jgi:hypothetical protein
MPEEPLIFGLRFGSNAALHPDRAELDRFLASPQKPRSRKTHAADFERYRELLGDVSAFERHSAAGSEAAFRDRMFYGTLSHTAFFSPVLLSSIELFQYYRSALSALDLRKPAAFIAAAEQELGGIDRTRKAHAERADRLKIMIEARKRTLKELGLREAELVAELTGIARYIKENLVRISLRCEKSIVLLVKLLTEGTEEQRLIGDIRDRIKEELKDGLQQGTVTQLTLLSAQQELKLLSREIATLLREDLFSMASVYEAMQQHTKTMAGRLARDLEIASRAKHGDLG